MTVALAVAPIASHSQSHGLKTGLSEALEGLDYVVKLLHGSEVGGTRSQHRICSYVKRRNPSLQLREFSCTL